MSFGMGRGLDFASFSKVVKTMRLVVITGTSRHEADMPIEMYNVPIFRIQIQIPERQAWTDGAKRRMVAKN